MLMNNLKISIIVPVYNSERYIDKCIKSLISQTYNNIEIIFVIDVKKDVSVDIINKYSIKDSRIKIVDIENKGAMSNRLEGLKRSTGQYVMFVDSDDYIDKNTIEKLYEYMNKYSNYDIDVIRFGYISENAKHSNEVNVISNPKFILKNDFENYIYIKMLSSYSYYPLWGQLIKKSKIDVNKINTSLVMGEDFSFNLDLYNSIYNILLVPECFYHYVKNIDSVMNKKSFDIQLKYMQDLITLYEKVLRHMDLWNIDNIQDRKNISLFILKEIAGHAIRIFYDNKTTNDQLIYFFTIICTSRLLCKIRKMITIDDIKKQKNKIKGYIKEIYNSNIGACIYKGKYIFFNGYKLVTIINKVKRRN